MDYDKDNNPIPELLYHALHMLYEEHVEARAAHRAQYELAHRCTLSDDAKQQLCDLADLMLKREMDRITYAFKAARRNNPQAPSWEQFVRYEIFGATNPADAEVD